MDYHKIKNILLSPISSRLVIYTLLTGIIILYPLIVSSSDKQTVIAYTNTNSKAQNSHIKVINEYEAQPTFANEPVNLVKDEIKRVFGDKWKIAYAVMRAESQENPKAIHYNNDSRKTHDRGLFQINSWWHREVSDSCAYNMHCNIKEAYRISSHGTNWNQWYTYTKGNYLQFM
jgi:hypothetical protein